MDSPFSAAHAQELLQRIGWIYYTIWAKDATQNPRLCNAPGLVWSKGDVNRSFLADQNYAYASFSELTTHSGCGDTSQQISKACYIGHLLQEFYKKSCFLPSGMGIAGIAMASGQCQWASSAEELFKQISSLSTYNKHHVPSELEYHIFKTVVCMPLRNGVGVLEMGTNRLVPESGVILQMLGSIFDGLASGIHIKREETIHDPALRIISASGLIPSGQYVSEHGLEPEGHNDRVKTMQMYEGRSALFRQSSISSSYCSSSSAASSPRSAGDYQKASCSNPAAVSTILLSPSRFSSLRDHPDMLINTATSLQDDSFRQADGIAQLDILDQLGQIGLHTGSTSPIADVPVSFGSQQQLNPSAYQYIVPALSQASHHPIYASNPALYSPATDVAASTLCLLSPPQEETHYKQWHFLPDRPHQQQPQWDKYKAYALSSRVDESAHEVSTDLPNQILLTSTPTAGNTSRACNDNKGNMGKQNAVLMLIEGASSTGYIHSSWHHVGNIWHDAAGGFDKASTVHSDQPTIPKPAGADNVYKYPGSDVASTHADQFTASNVAQQEGGKDHEYINRQLGYCININDRDFNISMQKRAGSDDHYEKMQQHNAGNKSDAGLGSGYGAFKSWSRSSLAVSHRKRLKKAARGSFLKKFLVQYLPKQQRESTVWIDHAIRRGSVQGPLTVGYVQSPERASNVLTQYEAWQASETMENEMAAVNHMYAERVRRRKQAECYKMLRSLLPYNAKKDKITILEHSIEYLKELKDRVFELEQEKSSLMYIQNEDSKDAMRNPSIYTSSQANASHLCLTQCEFRDHNCFQLRANKIMSIEDMNTTNIEILDALWKKNLRCIEFNSEFQKSTRKFDVKILAIYKDTNDCLLSLDGIQTIKDWWSTFMKSFGIDNPNNA